MIQLYQSGRAGDFTVLQDGLSSEEARTLVDNTARFLRARGETRAAEILFAKRVFLKEYMSLQVGHPSTPILDTKGQIGMLTNKPVKE